MRIFFHSKNVHTYLLQTLFPYSNEVFLKFDPCFLSGHLIDLGESFICNLLLSENGSSLPESLSLRHRLCLH
jgi:hypothetical protein